MDIGDVIVGGLVLGGAYVGYRWYCDHQAATAAPGTPTGDAASNMTASAAKSTTFGSLSLTRRLLAPVPIMPPRPPLSSQMSPGTATRILSAQGAGIRAQVAAANAQPLPNAPAHGSTLLMPVSGLRGALATQPAGDAPQPGDPSPGLFQRMIRGVQ